MKFSLVRRSSGGARIVVAWSLFRQCVSGSLPILLRVLPCGHLMLAGHVKVSEGNSGLAQDIWM